MMKSGLITLLTLAGAATVAATDFPPNMPECAKWCATEMLENKPGELGCNVGDVTCLCQNQNFAYGVRDCSHGKCGYNADSDFAIAWVNSFCGGILATATTSASYIESPSIEPTPIWTTTYTTTFTTDGIVSTTTGTSTVFGISGVPVYTSHPFTTVTSTFVSTHTGGSSTFEVTHATTFTTSVDSASLTEPTEAGHPSSSSSEGHGAQITGAPALGVLAAAGLAAVLF